MADKELNEYGLSSRRYHSYGKEGQSAPSDKIGQINGGVYKAAGIVLEDGQFGRLQVDSEGRLKVALTSEIELEASDIQIGAIEIKDHDGTNRATVNDSNELQIRDDDANTNLDTLVGAVDGNEIQADIIASLPAGTNAIGKVDAGKIHTIEQQPAITAGAYSAGDAVGGKLTFADAARVSGEGGIITGLKLIDDAGQDAELELWLFNQDFTAIDDNDAWAPTEADLENLAGVISSNEGTWRAAGTPSVIDIETARGYNCNTTDLYGQLVCRDTPTFAATDDITVKLVTLRD